MYCHHQSFDLRRVTAILLQQRISVPMSYISWLLFERGEIEIGKWKSDVRGWKSGVRGSYLGPQTRRATNPGTIVHSTRPASPRSPGRALFKYINRYIYIYIYVFSAQLDMVAHWGSFDATPQTSLEVHEGAPLLATL